MAVTPQLRAILIASALAVTAVLLGLYTLSQSHGRTEEPPLPPPAASSPLKKALPSPGTRTTVVKPTLRERYAKAAKDAGLPPAVASELGAHEVVVVALYAPSLPVDGFTQAEARAGAAAAGAGFVGVDVQHEGTATALTKLLGVLDAPATLVFRRPGELFLRLDGYTDHETIAQAALNADPTPGHGS